ncbi:LysR family transcriptional regulator [Phormidium tenue FACHB-886]|nr:LysR family transcriptional regulator [Phormidium tenue FACHB-886]
MDTLLSMKVLRQVVESGSFAAAAERLNLSTAMTSKHVMHLERDLGVRLLNRTSRHLSLTEAGTIYYEQCREMLDNLEVVEAAVRRSTVAAHGVLKLTAPVWFANPLFTEALADYRAQYPDVVLDLNLNDRTVDLVEEGFDLALRVTHKLDDSLIARHLCPIQFMLVGSPAYLQKNGYPQTSGDLSKHLMMLYSYSPFGDEIVLDGPNGRERVKLAASMRSNNTGMTYQAAIAGMGLAFLPEWLIQDALTSRRLEVLMPNYSWPASSLYAIYTSRRYLLPKVSTFVDFLATRFSPAQPAENC